MAAPSRRALAIASSGGVLPLAVPKEVNPATVPRKGGDLLGLVKWGFNTYNTYSLYITDWLVVWNFPPKCLVKWGFNTNIAPIGSE